ncbi:MAG: fatty acid desaturase [Bdellovibrionaceae bacterium]|nr:fatty acid desaturase [Pseudobdellovibrionaceae bacterium]
MDRATYIKIRHSLNLEQEVSALPIYLLQNAALILGIIFLWRQFEGSWIRYLGGPFVSVFMFRSFGVMHEAVHNAVSKNKFINDAVGIVSGAAGLFPYETWRKSHLSHHHWSGNVEKDSVMGLVLAVPKMSLQSQRFLSRIWKTWFPILAILQHVVFWQISLKIYRQNVGSIKVLMSLVAPILFWGTLLLMAPLEFSLGVLGPALFLFFVAIEVVNLPHHLQLPQFRGEEKFPAWQQYLTVRSCAYPKWIARFVVLNFNYHIEHHMFPDVPWYHLDKLHGPVRQALGDSYNTDPYFRWILENKPKDIVAVLAPAEINNTSSQVERVS